MLAVGWAVMVVAMTVAPTGGWAQEGEEAGESEEKRNVLAFFLGGTTESQNGESETGFTVGVDYERRLSKHVGVGLLFEGVMGNQEREIVLGLPLSLHPGERLRLVIAPLLEFTKKRTAGDKDAEFGIRAGGGYEFPLGQYALSPELYVDFIGSKVALVYGVSFAFGF